MNLKIEAIKRFDATFGGIASSLSRAIVKPRVGDKFSVLPSQEKIRILLIRPGGIGDAVLLYPALRVLREAYENAEIDILAEKRNAGILKGCTYTDNLFLYDLQPLIQLYRTLRLNYDIVIDTEQWHRFSAVVSYLTKAPIRVGFGTNERAELFTHSVSYSHDDYDAQSFLNLVSAVTGETYTFNPNEQFIPLDQSHISKVRPAIEAFRERWKAIVGLFCGATVAERRWGVNNFAELSKRLSHEGIGTVLVGGGSELEDSRRFEDITGRGNILNYIGKTSLVETAAIISELDLFVTGDTGLMHIAYGVGTTTVSLFGAGIQKKWAPQGKNHIVINKNLPCSPCTKFGYTPKCPYNVKCLRDITVEEVAKAALKLLSQQNTNLGS